MFPFEQAGNPEKITTLFTEVSMFDVLFMILIIVESGVNPKAISPKGAIGLAQITPIGLEEVRQQYGKYVGECPDLFNPVVNMDVGKHLLSHYLEVSKGDVRGALALYNGGFRAFKHYKKGTLHKVPESFNYVNRICSMFLKCNKRIGGL